MRIFATLLIAASLFVSIVPPAFAEGPAPSKKGAAPGAKEAAGERCVHGVQKGLCTRCKPKLIPVYQAKGDWCAEHARPETQCVICHPELGKKGIK